MIGKHTYIQTYMGNTNIHNQSLFFNACWNPHRWRIVETRGGDFPLVAVQFKAKAVLQRYKSNLNMKTTISLLDICLNGVSSSFPFILRGAFGSERVRFHVQGVLAHPQNP